MKKKLTLSVDRALVEKAKKLGVNISEITEQVLKHVTGVAEKKIVTKDELNKAYEELFKAMLPAMKKFGTAVKVGYMNIEIKVPKSKKVTDMGSFPVYLLQNGTLWSPYLEESPKLEDVIFYLPKEILSNYIDSLVKASEWNREKLKELEIFKRVIEALTETTISMQ